MVRMVFWSKPNPRTPPVMNGQDPVLSIDHLGPFHSSHDQVIDLLWRDPVPASPASENCSLVHEVRQVSTAESRSPLRDDAQGDIFAQFPVLAVHPQDFPPFPWCRAIGQKPTQAPTSLDRWMSLGRSSPRRFHEVPGTWRSQRSKWIRWALLETDDRDVKRSFKLNSIRTLGVQWHNLIALSHCFFFFSGSIFPTAHVDSSMIVSD